MRDYTHLTKDDRQRLYTYLGMGLSIRAISKKLLRHPSTLYREVNRNNEHVFACYSSSESNLNELKNAVLELGAQH